MDSGRLERAYRTFVRCHQVVAEATSEEDVVREVCRVAVEELGFTLAWVGLKAPQGPRVLPVAQAGYEAGYLSSIRVTWSDDEHGQGPTGRAIREGSPQVARDIATDPRYTPWREDALRRGYASSAALPLCDGPRCIGALNLYAAEPDAFDDEEIALLEEVAIDLVLGILRFRTAAQLDALSTRVEQVSRAETAATAVAALAHDVNNLLLTISLSVGAAQMTRSPAEQSDALDDAQRAAEAAGGMMRKLLSLTRRVVPGTSSSDVDQAVQASTALLSRLAPSAQLVVELGAAGARAQIAAIDLDRILINLVVNAAQAMSRGGRIGIATEVRELRAGEGPERASALSPGPYLVLTVSDDGEGIAPDVLPRIFEPFFTTKGGTGTGLGLASVRRIARAAGGDVEVQSERGVGTRFAVFVPVREAAAWPR